MSPPASDQLIHWKESTSSSAGSVTGYQASSDSVQPWCTTMLMVTLTAKMHYYSYGQYNFNGRKERGETWLHCFNVAISRWLPPVEGPCCRGGGRGVVLAKTLFLSIGVLSSNGGFGVIVGELVVAQTHVSLSSGSLIQSPIYMDDHHTCRLWSVDIKVCIVKTSLIPQKGPCMYSRIGLLG